MMISDGINSYDTDSSNAVVELLKGPDAMFSNQNMNHVVIEPEHDIRKIAETADVDVFTFTTVEVQDDGTEREYPFEHVIDFVSILSEDEGILMEVLEEEYEEEEEWDDDGLLEDESPPLASLASDIFSQPFPEDIEHTSIEVELELMEEFEETKAIVFPMPLVRSWELADRLKYQGRDSDE